MIERPTSRVIPNKPRYFAIDIQGEPWHLRVPDYATIGELFDIMPELAAAPEGSGRRVSVLMDAAGAAIGCAWCHQRYDLEAGDTPDTSEPQRARRYGRLVVDELQEHGLTMEEIQSLATPLLERMRDAMQATARSADLGNG